MITLQCSNEFYKTACRIPVVVLNSPLLKIFSLYWHDCCHLNMISLLILGESFRRQFTKDSKFRRFLAKIISETKL